MTTYAQAEKWAENMEKAEQNTPTGDEWTEIAAQLDYNALLDAEYWRHRREDEYRLFLERKYGVPATEAQPSSNYYGT